MTESPYYTTDEAATILRKHRDTIQRMCKRGAIAGAQKIGHDWLIPKTSIDPPTSQQKPATPPEQKERHTA